MRYYTTKQIAEHFNMSQKFFYRLASRNDCGTMPVELVRFGRALRWKIKEK